MRDVAFRTFGRRADEYFERGKAAAKGGQRTVAAALLRQAVQLNPQHEQAWLWLSGVVDDRDEIANSLKAVLHINPDNVRARMGLASLDIWAVRPSEPGTATLNYLRRISHSAFAPEPPPAPVPWWMGWRDAAVALRWTVRLLWLIPAILLLSTLSVRTVLAVRPLPKMPTYLDVVAATPVPAAASPRQRDAAPAAPPRDWTAINLYFRQVRAEQQSLQQAVQTYRERTEQNHTTSERVAAVRALSEQVESSRTTLAALQPPSGAEGAHAAYLDGLALESLALQELLAFFGNGDAAAASRAAIQLEDARSKIASGKAGWDAFVRSGPGRRAPAPSSNQAQRP